MEEEKEVKKRKSKSFLGWMIVLGQWACVFALIGVAVYIYSQAETLRTSPCEVCQDELGMYCTDMPVYVEDSFVDKNPMESLNLDWEAIK